MLSEDQLKAIESAAIAGSLIHILPLVEEIRRLRHALAEVVNTPEGYANGNYCGTCKHKSDLAEQALGTKR